ncbi:MAG: PAC2 family protein [Planctomycetes bacterium]|nr:PAC2 family protein [Planctomycetota bacterium]
MTDKTLDIYHDPKLQQPSLVIGFDGWMDGGNVSTGTIDYLRLKLEALPLGSIDPDGFYILNIPGPMEMAALFRPHVRFEDGLIKQYDYPANRFFVQTHYNLILFNGKEPNLDWERFAQAIITVCKRFGVRQILYVGSVAGLTPHSRGPRIMCTFVKPESEALAEKMGFHLSQYEGPASFVTHLSLRVAEQHIDVIGLVAEIPAYLQGYNPKCIEVMVRCVSSILELHLACEDLRALGEEYEKRVTELVSQQPELAQRVEQLEQNYDNEVFENEMEDLKSWLHSRGIRLD